MMQFLVRHLTYPLWERLNGSTDLRTLRTLRQWEQLSRPDMLALQRQRLRALLVHARDTVPFYREWFAAHGFHEREFDEPEALRKLPLLDKTTINANIDTMVSSSADRTRLWKDSTGGSTGQPLYFYIGERRKSWVRALTFRENLWLGCRPGDRIARFWGSGRDVRVPVGARAWLASTWVRRHRVFDAYDVSDDKIRAFLDGIADYRPTLVVAYARALFQAARYVERRQLRPYRSSALVITSESVSPEERDTIAAAFGAPVVNRYASRELGQVASGCGQSSLLHTIDDAVIVQLESIDGHADRRTGRLVVTDLSNYDMPLIRYDTGDHGTAATDPCPCGRPFGALSAVEGRVLDLFVRPDGGRVPGLSFVHFFRQGQAIRNFQVVQHTPTRIEVRLVLSGPLSDDEWQRIVQGLRNILGHGSIEVIRTECSEIETPISGKHRFAISKVAS